MKFRASTCITAALAAFLSLNATAVIAKTSPDIISGHYLENASGDTLDAKVLPDGKLRVALFCYYPSKNISRKYKPGGPNTGELDTIITFKNNTATYEIGHGEKLCQISFRFNGKRVSVSQIEKGLCTCQFGMNVNASGIYKKLTSSPHFEEGLIAK